MRDKSSMQSLLCYAVNNANLRQVFGSTGLKVGWRRSNQQSDC